MPSAEQPDPDKSRRGRPADPHEGSPSGSRIDPKQFVRHVTPLLEQQDLPALMAVVKARWTDRQIVSLLRCGHCDARKCAALALSLIGPASCLEDLARQLADPDPMVNQMAEHAMWSIWFRGGAPEACRLLVRGTESISARDLDKAVDRFDRALAISPDFAEAYNQRAIAHYLAERFHESVADCRRAVEAMPCHFGAWGGMGHSLAHLGRSDEAVRCYREALRINPHLDCIRELCEELSGPAAGNDE